MPQKKIHKIFSLDWGGSWTIIEVKCLIPNPAVRSDGKLNTLIGLANFPEAAADFKSWFSNSPESLP